MAQAALSDREERAAGRRSRSVIGYAWRVSGRHQPWLCLLAVAIFPLSTVPLELQRRLIDRAIANRDLRLLIWLGAAYLGVVLLQGGLKYGLRVYRGIVSERAIRGLRRALYRRGRGDEGETVSMVASEVEQVGGFIGECFSEPLLQGGVLLSVIGYMLVVEPTMALVSLAFFVPQLALVPLIQRFVNRRAQRKVKLVRKLGDRVVDHDADSKPYDRLVDKVYRVRISYFRYKFFIKFLNNLMNHLGPLSVLVVGGYLVIEGQTTVGTLVAFISGFDRMADPSRELLAYYRLASQTQVQYRLLSEQIDVP